MIDVTASVKLARRASIKPAAVAMPMLTKANSPPGPSSMPVSIATGQDSRNSRPSPHQHHALTAINADHAAGEPQRLAQQLAEIDLHADGEKENAEQQALERLDRRLDGLAVFGFGEQQAGDESAERHGQTGLTGDRRRRR